MCGSCPHGLEGDRIKYDPIIIEGYAISCSDEPCYPGISCTQKSTSVSCGPCPQGMIGDEVHCTQITCADNPCFYGVDCTGPFEIGVMFECGSCPHGMTGDGLSMFEQT